MLVHTVLKGGDTMKNKSVDTRRLIAVSFSLAYIILVCMSVFFDKSAPSEFVAIVSAVVGYYFGGETALSSPKNIVTIDTTAKESSNVKSNE